MRLDGSLAHIATYYSERALRYGAVPLGVDWTCWATQQMRFVQLLSGFNLADPFSVNDLGCGYGALRRFIGSESSPAGTADSVDYLGIDVSADMVRLARAELAGFAAADAVLGSSCPRVADYSVASGIFNVCLDDGRDAWEGVIETTLRDMACSSRRGTAVNFLAHTAEPPKAGLYRTEAARWIRFANEELGATAEVISGYGMSEFTLLAR